MSRKLLQARLSSPASFETPYTARCVELQTCFAGAAAVSEFSAVGPSLQTGSGSAAVSRVRGEAEPGWVRSVWDTQNCHKSGQLIRCIAETSEHQQSHWEEEGRSRKKRK